MFCLQTSLEYMKQHASLSLTIYHGMFSEGSFSLITLSLMHPCNAHQERDRGRNLRGAVHGVFLAYFASSPCSLVRPTASWHRRICCTNAMRMMLCTVAGGIRQHLRHHAGVNKTWSQQAHHGSRPTLVFPWSWWASLNGHTRYS